MVLGAPALAEKRMGERRRDVKPEGRMQVRLLILALFYWVSACASVSEQPEAALGAVESARVQTCPTERVQANARSEGFGPTSGVAVEDIALTPLASDPTRALRLRRIIVQPGGVIAWHDHVAVQGMAILVSGEMVELRNSCLDPIPYRAGDVAIEDTETAHSWRNEGSERAVVLVSHVVAR
jgi:quercetin dioxygenase-like cupin family protein